MMRTSLPTRWRPSGKGPLFLLAVIIALSTYTHTWNPAGFPVLHDDEGTYVKRGVGILNHEVLYGLHDHPFFGQTVLAGFMYVSGYPGLLDDPPSDPSHLGALYAYPRAFMGLLAVLDTLLVYLIADRMFGRRVAAVAAVIFAVAPMSLLLRMVMLDSILLPFVLSSVLLALHSRGPGSSGGGNSNRQRHALLLASGACMGLAILTKVPAAAMVPPCAILAYWASGRIRDVGLWLAPALVIPAVWPAYAAQAGQLDAWLRDVAWQAGRSNGGLPEAIRRLFEYDPVLVPLGMAGFAFAAACLVLRAGRMRGPRTAETGKAAVTKETAHRVICPPVCHPVPCGVPYRPLPGTVQRGAEGPRVPGRVVLLDPAVLWCDRVCESLSPEHAAAGAVCGRRRADPVGGRAAHARCRGSDAGSRGPDRRGGDRAGGPAYDRRDRAL